MRSRPSFDPGYSTEDLTAVYSAESTVAAMLAFEGALALALADAGIAPAAEAERVAEACRAGVDDPGGILESTWDTGTPIIALRDAIDGGEWFHYGATSQDAIDTGQVLQARSALDLIESQLVAIAQRLNTLTVENRDQPHLGRTFLQNARPTTFGFRTATWLSAVLGDIESLRRERGRLVVQLGGPVGTLAAYGDAATRVVESLAKRLELRTPDISWHTDRSRFVSLAQTVERTANTLSKIGTDIALLASSPIAEISVRSGGSSSMPEKRNPIDAIRAVAAATACSGAVAMLAATSGHELDRGIGSWHVEWVALPLTFQTGGAAAEAIGLCLDSLEVDRDAMSALASVGFEEFDPGQIDRVLAAFDTLVG